MGDVMPPSPANRLGHLPALDGIRAIAVVAMFLFRGERDVTIFDDAEWICPAGDCTEFDALRPDAVHFGAPDEIRLPVLDALMANALEAAGYAARR